MEILRKYQNLTQLGLIESCTQSSCANQEVYRERILEAYRQQFKPDEQNKQNEFKVMSRSSTMHPNKLASKSENDSSLLQFGIDELKAINLSLKEKFDEVNTDLQMVRRELASVIVERDRLKSVITTESSTRVLQKVSCPNNSDLKLEIYKKQIASLTTEISQLRSISHN